MKTFNLNLFLSLLSGFVLATIVGTVSHELGHYLAARFMGLEARINYAYTYLVAPEGVEDVVLSAHQSLIFLLGGPLMTMLIGSTGLVLLITYQWRLTVADPLPWRQWVLVFLALFWLRPLANLVMGLLVYCRQGHFPEHNDEARWSLYLGWPMGSVGFICATIGALVAGWVVFRCVPAKQRLTFILAGLVGGVLGYLIWLESLGKYLMP